MSEQKRNKIVVMNFSGIYTEEEFEEETSWLDVSHIHGTNCYCDGEAFGELLGCIDGYPAGGIHFIDSGNYHYMSRIWLEKVDEPVTLVVFDNHTDMQPPAFEGILSCGGWIEAAFTQLDGVREVILIGPDEAAFSQVESGIREKVTFLSRERLREMKRLQREEFLKEALEKRKETLYLSVDKDILCPGEADTSWSQGDMKLSELTDMLKMIFDCAKENGREVYGVDICGESDAGECVNKEENIKANRELVRCLREAGF